MELVAFSLVLRVADRRDDTRDVGGGPIFITIK